MNVWHIVAVQVASLIGSLLGLYIGWNLSDWIKKWRRK